MLNRKKIIEIVGLPNFINKTIYKDGTNADIIKTLFACLPAATKQTAEISNSFKGINDYETLKNIHTFIRQNLIYRKDLKGHQQIKLPNRYLLESGDCKSKALFIASLLNNLKFKHGFVFANYNPLKGNIPSHVYNYAILPNGKKVYIDGTYNKFDNQPKPNFKKEMIIQELSNDLQTIGAPKRQPLKNAVKKVTQAPKQIIKKAATVAPKVAQKAKQVAKTVVKGAATVGALPGRAAFLAIVGLNVRDYAKNLNSLPADRKQKFLNAWEQLGGKKDEVLKAIAKGASKKRILDEGPGISEPVTATVAAATPVIAALATFLEKANKAAESVKKVAEPTKKIIDTAKKNKTLQQLKKVTDENPELKKKLQALGKSKGQQVLNKVLNKVTPASAATPAQTENQAQAPENLDIPQESTQPEQTGNKINFKTLALLGLGGLALYKIAN
jgi:hypothetical protein